MFMQLEVWSEPGATFQTDDGEQFLPLSMGEGLRRVVLNEDGEPTNFHEPTDPSETWWARYSAAGYLDCTDPVYAKSPLAALDACFNLYGDEQDELQREEYELVKKRIIDVMGFTK